MPQALKIISQIIFDVEFFFLHNNSQSLRQYTYKAKSQKINNQKRYKIDKTKKNTKVREVLKQYKTQHKKQQSKKEKKNKRTKKNN